MALKLHERWLIMALPVEKTSWRRRLMALESRQLQVRSGQLQARESVYRIKRQITYNKIHVCVHHSKYNALVSV